MEHGCLRDRCGKEVRPGSRDGGDGDDADGRPRLLQLLPRQNFLSVRRRRRMRMRRTSKRGCCTDDRTRRIQSLPRVLMRMLLLLRGASLRDSPSHRRCGCAADPLSSKQSSDVSTSFFNRSKRCKSNQMKSNIRLFKTLLDKRRRN